MARELNPV